MVRKLLASVSGMLLVAASLFISVAAAEDYPYFGPQPFDVNKYYYFGDATYPATQAQGLSLILDPTSVSYQSIKGTLSMDWNIIQERQITKFHILANGVMVDSVEPYFDRAIDPPVYQEYYYLDINVSDQYIGSENYFQVVGVKEGKHFDGGTENDYVVAWSNITPTVRFKPLPTTDEDTHGLLAAILEKLEEMKNELTGKLDQLKQAVENIYEVKPETQQRFDASLAALQNALPSQQVADQVDQISDVMDESRALIENGPKDMQFAKINTFGIEFYLIDFSGLEEHVGKIRNVLRLVLWCEFFIFVIRLLVPKLTA